MSQPAEPRGGPRRERKMKTGVVQSVQRLTPHMIRIVLGGEGLAIFSAGEFTDHYLKIFFPLPGVQYPQPFDIAHVRETMPRELWPRVRTYTVRHWDSGRRELTVDVVYHGDVGLAGPWAAGLRPGDIVHFGGPGGGYAPPSDVDWHLLVGDESALPAIAASLERLPGGARAHVFIEVAGPEDEQRLDSPGDVVLRWVHRGAARPGDALVDAVTALEFPSGRVGAFVHGEAGTVKRLRHLLFVERGVTREGQSLSGYWRIGADEDTWQATKREWNTAVEAEQDGNTPN